MERIDIFSRVNMADVMSIAIITLPRKDCMTLFTKVQSGFTQMTCIRPEDGTKTCLYCESTNWSKSNNTCFLYYSYGNGKIDFFASYKDEDSMFDAMKESNSNLDPVRYTFSSLDDLYSKVKDEKQAFYFTLDSYKYDICPECLFKELSDSFKVFTVDRVKEFATDLFYDNCDVAIILKDDTIYHIAHAGNTIMAYTYKKKELTQTYITD